jgi:hypothetical protein
MGAPVGNQNAAKAKIVGDALRKLAVQEDQKRLRAGLEKVMDAFEAGEPWAAQFVRDTLDGKPAQAVIGGDPEDPPIQTLVKVAFVGSNPGGV